MNQQQFHQTTVAMKSGLTRYRSAPSSYFTTLLNTNNSSSDGFEFDQNDFDNPETHTIFINSSTEDAAIQQQLLAPIKSEIEPPHGIYHHHHHHHHHSSSSVNSQISSDHNSQSQNYAMDRVIGSINSNLKVEGGFAALIRHPSSPAGLFHDIHIQNEYGAIMRSLLGSCGAGNNANPEASFSSASRFIMKSQIMPPIPETPSKNMGENSSIDVQFPMNSWDDSSILSDTFLKQIAENNDKTFSNANTSNDHDQNINEGEKKSTTRLSHHLSLPTNFSQLLQDSVPCKIRAKRGFATHPRSIAERVRRTKISDRIRKLQELVPNMERQTNTSDMLDLAVDYVKDLQTQVKTLLDDCTNCSCSAGPKS